MKNRSWRLIGAAAVTLVLWASGFVAIRLAVREYPPEALALLRFGVASLAFAGYWLLRPAERMRVPDRRDLPGFLFIGISGITVYHLALNAGERTVSAGTASLIVSLNAIFTALIAAVVLSERLGGRGWIGVLIGFAGAAILSLGESRALQLEPGAGLVLIAALSQAIYFVAQKPYLARYRPLEVTAYAIWLGTLGLLPFAAGLAPALRDASPGATLAAIYLGIFPGAVAYVLWAYVLARLPAGQATSILYLVPPLALLIGWVVLGERPSALPLVGGGIALAGVALVNTPNRSPRSG